MAIHEKKDKLYSGVLGVFIGFVVLIYFAFSIDPCRESRTLSYGIIKQPSACNSEMLGLD
jgi:hypothetical protein